jgi:hypothetical protein
VGSPSRGMALLSGEHAGNTWQLRGTASKLLEEGAPAHLHGPAHSTAGGPRSPCCLPLTREVPQRSAVPLAQQSQLFGEAQGVLRGGSGGGGGG